MRTPPPSRRPRLALLAAAVLLAAACGPGEKPTPRHVLLITVDTLRADHLSLYGYPRPTSPALEELAAAGVTFDRAFSQWPKTGTSFASAFVGQYPQTTGLTHKAAVQVPDEYLTLPEFFSQLGFTTVAVVSNAVLGDHLGWNRGFDEYHETWKLAPETSEDPVEYRKWINAGVVNQLALPLLEKHRDDERLFAWIHYSDPHAPYLLPEGVENRFVGDPYYLGEEEVSLEDPHATAIGDHRDLKHYIAQYDANVRFADDHVGELLARARELGLLDDAAVIFTADHGESLGEHDYFFGHGRLPYNDGLHVPLVISYPPAIVPGRRIGAPVEIVDLYATLQAWLAPDRPVPGLEGRSLLPWLFAETPAGKPLAFSEAGGGSPLTHFRVVQDGRFKLIYHPPSSHRGREIPARWELYDLAADPGETHNLAGDTDSPELRRLAQDLRGWMKGSDWIRRPQAEIEAHSQETLKALRALGYVE